MAIFTKKVTYKIFQRLLFFYSRIKYEVYNDCNLDEIGEPFADQPYALAVQQGSHLQVMTELISRLRDCTMK